MSGGSPARRARAAPDVGPAVSAVLVAYSGAFEALLETIASLARQTHPPSQVLCVDQSPDGRFAPRLREAAPQVEVIVSERNLGYSSACNLAAQRTHGTYVLFLNPDTVAEPECVEVLARALEAEPGAALAGAQVLLPDGRVNAGDNALHLTGLSWAGRLGQPAESGPPRPAAVVSGAAAMVRRGAFEALGGYTEGFFMYYDDVDLAWRVRLRGWEVLFCPDARVVHDYAFAKGDYKWRYLERNRWWCLLAHLEARTLLLLAPLLLATEAAILARARREGWLGAKLAAWGLLWRERSALLARRRAVQAERRIGDGPILARMQAAVDSPYLGTVHGEGALRAYRRGVMRLTKGRGEAESGALPAR